MHSTPKCSNSCFRSGCRLSTAQEVVLLALSSSRCMSLNLQSTSWSKGCSIASGDLLCVLYAGQQVANPSSHSLHRPIICIKSHTLWSKCRILNAREGWLVPAVVLQVSSPRSTALHMLCYCNSISVQVLLQ